VPTAKPWRLFARARDEGARRRYPALPRPRARQIERELALIEKLKLPAIS